MKRIIINGKIRYTQPHPTLSGTTIEIARGYDGWNHRLTGMHGNGKWSEGYPTRKQAIIASQF